MRISLVDPVKGTYIKNSNEDSKLDYIPPILTKPFNFKVSRHTSPSKKLNKYSTFCSV